MNQLVATYFKKYLKIMEQKHLKLIEMSSYIANSKSSVKLEVRGDTIALNKRLINKLSKKLFDQKSSAISKIFEFSTNEKSMRYSPIFLNADARKFFDEIKHVIGEYNGKNIIDSLTMMTKYGLTEQTIIDRITSLYILKSGIYLNTSQNVKRKEEDKPASRQYIKINPLMKKYLRPSLEHLVESLQEKGYDDEKAIFKDGKEDVDHLEDVKLRNMGILRKGLTKQELDDDEKNMIGKLDDKIFKEYAKIIWKAKIDAKISDGALGEDVYIKAAVTVSNMEFKNGDEMYKLGPYTEEQIIELKVKKDENSTKLAVRALIDTEKVYTKLIKEKRSER